MGQGYEGRWRGYDDIVLFWVKLGDSCGFSKILCISMNSDKLCDIRQGASVSNKIFLIYYFVIFVKSSNTILYLLYFI